MINFVFRVSVKLILLINNNMETLLEEFVIWLEMRGSRQATVKFYRNYLKSFFKITQSDVSILGDPEGLEKMYLIIHKRDITPSTRRKYVIVLQIFSDFLLKKKLLEVNHARELLKVPRIQKRIPIALSFDEVDRIRSHVLQLWGGEVQERNSMIIDCFLYTGLRRGEISRLKRSDIYPDRIMVREGKGWKDRIIYLPASFSSRLMMWMEKHDIRPNEVIFKNIYGGPMAERTFHTIFHHISRKMGKNIYPHLLRHTYASHCILKGVDIYTLQKQMGHSDITTTSIYLYTNDQERYGIMQRMG